jgi:hypothetical protein
MAFGKRVLLVVTCLSCLSFGQLSGEASLSGSATLTQSPVSSGATYVNYCVGSAASTAATCATNINIASGNLLVVRTKTSSSGSTATVTLSISAGTGACGTWSYAINATTLNGNFQNAVGYCIVSGSGTATIQAAWTNGTGILTDISVAEYQPASAWGSPVLDGSAVYTITSPAQSTCPTGNITTTNANDLLVAVCDVWNNAQTWNALPGWTNEANSERNTSGWYDQYVTSTGTQSAAIPLSVNDTGTGIILAFKD